MGTKTLATALILGVGMSVFGVGNLQPLQGWEEVASGVWKVHIGDVGHELAYTSLAARPPRIKALNALSKVPFPFTGAPIEFLRSDDRMIQVRIPAASEESIYGFGLQLDGIRKSGKVLNLNVDHWEKGEGRTHAPVPFYISSRGYGVLFNTARFLKVHVQVGNRKDSPNNPPPVDRNPPPEEPAKGPWMAQPAGDAVEAHVSANGLEMIVFAGDSLQDIVARYNLYCGGGALPPTLIWAVTGRSMTAQPPHLVRKTCSPAHCAVYRLIRPGRSGAMRALLKRVQPATGAPIGSKICSTATPPAWGCLEAWRVTPLIF